MAQRIACSVLVAVLLTVCCSGTTAAVGATNMQCGSAAGGTLIDLTVPVRAGMPVWAGQTGLARNWRALSQSQDEGDIVNQSFLTLDAHTGTHIDAPNHFLNGGATIEQLPLSALIGPADIIDVPDSTNVTADALRALDVPADATRLLFRTLNTRRRLMEVTPFASDYVGLDASAARWLAKERPGVVLVGIDYVSIGMLEDIVEAHKELFRKGTVVVEGLDLSAAPTGRHHLTCLPLLLVGSDGAPGRCILQTNSQGASK